MASRPRCRPHPAVASTTGAAGRAGTALWAVRPVFAVPRSWQSLGSGSAVGLRSIGFCAEQTDSCLVIRGMDYVPDCRELQNRRPEAAGGAPTHAQEGGGGGPDLLFPGQRRDRAFHD